MLKHPIGNKAATKKTIVALNGVFPLMSLSGQNPYQA
jgi:hypothetical protein